MAHVPRDGLEQVEKEAVVVVMTNDDERRMKNRAHVDVQQWSSCEQIKLDP